MGFQEVRGLEVPGPPRGSAHALRRVRREAVAAVLVLRQELPAHAGGREDVHLEKHGEWVM